MNRSIPILSNEFYHVYSRGNNRQTLFRDPADYRAFLLTLHGALAKYRVDRIAYTLMPNHFHMIVMQRAGGKLTRMMNAVGTSYAKRFNLRHSHSGHVFQGRYQYSHISGDLALVEVARYIHLNPVRAGLVMRPEDWEFSDFKEAMKDGILRRKQAFDDGLSGEVFQYAEFVNQGIRDIEFVRQLLFGGETQTKASFSLDQTEMKDALKQIGHRPAQTGR